MKPPFLILVQGPYHPMTDEPITPVKPPADSETRTIRYYDIHAREHAERTSGADMRAAYGRFLARVPAGGSVLDAGCGSGRDSKFFSGRGYCVTAIDASAGYAREAWERSGVQVRVVRFQELDYELTFDGIWASASLLHVPRAGLLDVLNRFARALKPGGVVYVSFKEGAAERTDELDRYFNDMNASILGEEVARTELLRIEEMWMSRRRVDSDQKWLNALLALKRT